MTTTTLALHARALAFAREAVPLSPFAQMLVDEAGGLQQGPSGLYQLRDAANRLLRLHDALDPDELLVWARADHGAERIAALRMLTGAPLDKRSSLRGSILLHDVDAGGLANGIHFAFEKRGYAPERLVVMMNEDEEYASAFPDRARWLLDVPSITVRCVDAEVGLIERDILAVAPHASDPRAAQHPGESRRRRGALSDTAHRLHERADPRQLVVDF
jgi:hypothetical protein